ncbi:hypothetical protein GGR52DRAFT_574157 [Hypoxylon sp. FL1284]|nr:hypothetical protein GGR52DRAFT_574157 [Hypoxylon sp. FL1284]
MYGSPYSQPYLEHVFRTDLARVSERVAWEAFEPISGEVKEMPQGVKRHSKSLETLWKLLCPDEPYTRGCDGPFVVRFPREPDVRVQDCLGRDEEEICAALREAARMLGGSEIVLIATMSTTHQVSLCLDFDESVDLEAAEAEGDFSFMCRFKQAWSDVLDVYIKWLRGRNVPLVAGIREVQLDRLRGRSDFMVSDVDRAMEIREARIRDEMLLEHQMRSWRG